jgi:tRNA threonylcarbamoyl adenosine modification protein YeaZ
MKILALDFSSDARSAAVIETGPACSDFQAGPAGSSPQALTLSVVSERAPDGTKAFALIKSALAQAKVTRKEIKRIALGLGPGSYAGIRVSIALAQGWQLAGDVRLIGLCSLDTLAAQAQEEGLRGRLHTVVDAQRNEVYLASYDLDDRGWRASAPLRLAPADEIRSLAAGGQQVTGPEVLRWCQTGRVLLPQARHLALMAAERTNDDPAESLAPIYLRPISFTKAAPATPKQPEPPPA